MTHRTQPTQIPRPGTRSALFRGDTLTFELRLKSPAGGSAWIRTNIGHGCITRSEIIREVDLGEIPLGRDWFDIPMQRMSGDRFAVTLGFCENGHFEGKCFFLPEKEREPVWPEGPNVEINVSSADVRCGNIVYNAFVRQFGPNKTGGFNETSLKPRIQELDKTGYTVIPPSGTFRNLIQELDFIIGKLGCRIIQLLPVHPTPTTYGRMGRFGSPYAALSFTEVDPALAEFDPRATPLDQFCELVDAVHARCGKIFIDIAINHTGWAASLHEAHPQWLARTEDGEIEVPGAWGVQWEDLTRLDYSHKDLWRYMAKIFMTWCHRGVDGFRCDAGYMIPVEAWRYIIASVREQFPDTVFVLEGLGGKMSVTKALLNKANFDWAYSELFQNYDRRQIEDYFPVSLNLSTCYGTAIHFAETHDNNRLAATSMVYARMRTLLCAMLSHCGAFGFANGVEWLATEKIDVHDAKSLNWGAEINQVDTIRRISTLLRSHPAFFDQTEMEMINRGSDNTVVLTRRHRPSGRRLLILANLETEKESVAVWNGSDFGKDAGALFDLVAGRKAAVDRHGETRHCRLGPGQVACLSEDAAERIDDAGREFGTPVHMFRQQLRAKALEVFQHYHENEDLGNFDLNRAADDLQKAPVEFCRQMNPHGDEPRVVVWQWPRDIRRHVMVPADHFLMVRSPNAFTADIDDGQGVLARQPGLACKDGSFFALFMPLPDKNRHFQCTLKISVFTPEKPVHDKGVLLALTTWNNIKRSAVFNRRQILDHPMRMLATNGLGGMLRAHVRWGELDSRYDALLAANPDTVIPEDRRVMFSRCRAWLVYQGYSQQIDSRCLNAFFLDDRSRGFWDFLIPCGQGQQVQLVIGVEMIAGENAMKIGFYRCPASGRNNELADDNPIKIILRPDIEDRNFHDTTKAYTGPEHRFPQNTVFDTDSFTFRPHPPLGLQVRIRPGAFTWEPEWHYMVHRSQEASRGLDPDSDLFSPGYFSALFTGGQTIELTAEATDTRDREYDLKTGLSTAIKTAFARTPPKAAFARRLRLAMDHYVVQRSGLKTVIAGYPWFLDWGRDALIAARGLIADGRIPAAKDVLRQFGRFEKDGTIPNMIRGNDAGNRDTSDGPLWLLVACAELVRAEGDAAFLDEPCPDRTIRRILFSIATAYARGTPNGIRMDADSGLIFSPAHFTWMDTNHPAGTPREGYPIEIQVLWYAALTFLATLDAPSGGIDWKGLAQRVRKSIRTLFWLDDHGWLSDCRHAKAGVPARAAAADDALRPNQLLAITLEAVSGKVMCRRILAACQELLVPGAIRSLADRPVERPIEIRHHGRLLNDPYHPYRGRYEGDEDTSRKPVYHNGTAWTWLFPVFCEAWAKVYGKPGRAAALNWLASSSCRIDEGCIGHIPEICDGDAPHHERGCDAQAWGTSELLRVLCRLDPSN